jgi:hypothetical protein
MVLFQKPEDAQPPASPGQIPETLEKLRPTLKGLMDLAEDITGIPKRELSMAFIKGGLKGGSVDSVLSFLGASTKPAAKDKWLERVKALAIWGPVAIFGLGLAFFFLIIMMKLMIKMVGGLSLP